MKKMRGFKALEGREEWGVGWRYREGVPGPKQKLGTGMKEGSQHGQSASLNRGMKPKAKKQQQ